VAQNTAMAKPASKVAAHVATTGPGQYEQPLNERMRTFMRLEFLYQQLLYNSELEADWATRATIATLLEIMAILSRGDVRSEIHKELDQQLDALQRFQSQPDVDSGRLDALMRNLIESRAQIDASGTQYLQPLKDSAFLNAIKNRSAIPGGTCEFDLPEYSHWLRQLCDAVTEVLWLIRESAQPVEKLAEQGMYQHNMQKDVQCRLLRISMTDDQALYPEISGSQHRFTVRFLEWSTIECRAVQASHDVPFQLSVC
jgi:cell division protein ZapD